MNSKQKHSANPASAKKKLFWLLAIFLLALSMPVYLLLNKVYAQLETEAYFHQRNQAEMLLDRIQQRLLESIAAEETRPIAEYSFFNILENPLLRSTAVKFSPISTMPPESGVPGLLGYFQINPDNSFHTPVLPELSTDEQAGLSSGELQPRIELRDKLRNLLTAIVPGKNDTSIALKDEVSRNRREQKKRVGKQDRRLDDIFHAKEMESGSSAEQRYLNQSANTDVPALEKTQTLSEEQLQKLNIDAGRWNKSQSEGYAKSDSKTASKILSRKEKVKLPDQSLAGALFNRAKQYAETASDDDANATAISPENSEPAIAEAAQEPISINILSFDTEVSSLQMLILANDNYLCFYRKVWRENGRYTQGFIVRTHDFFSRTVQVLFRPNQSGPFSSLLVASDGKLLQQFKPLAGSKESLLYRSSLAPPFQRLELIINSSAISAGPATLVIDLLAIFLGMIIIAGLILFYRLAAGQIELAEQQRNFISAVSHELKTPLTSIRMYGEMLRSEWVTDEIKKKSYYDFIFFESERLSRLIDNVLQLARLENHSEKSTLVSADPSSLLQKIKAKIAAQIESSGFQLNILPDKTLRDGIIISVDEDAFFQIMINLVDNAIKFSDDTELKIIDIGLKLTGRSKEVIYYVRDYGPGIDKAQQKKIFRLFYRVGNELTRTKPGTGIGLALIVQLADKMNAKIDLINRQPGVEFQLKFIYTS